MRWHHGIIGGLAAALVTGALPGLAAGERVAEGSLTYLPRIALPPEAIALVEARGPDGAFLAEARIPTEGRQVPIPFSLPLPGGEAVTLHAAILTGAKPIWLAAPREVAEAEGIASVGEVVLGPVPETGIAHVLRCGAEEIDLSLTDVGIAVLTARGSRTGLVHVPTASGMRYDAPGAPGTFIWTKGGEGIASLAGTELADCVIGVPRAEPAFVARGNEPGWNLEISAERVVLVTDYGAERREAARPAPALEDGAIVYRLADPEAVIAITPGICRDDATGMPHGNGARVETGGRVLTGCAGAPVDLLAGAEWVVEDIGDAGVIDDARVTLEFRTDAPASGPRAEGRVFGQGGCNRYNGGFTLTGEGLSFGPAAATMMACAEALMGLEQAFFMALTKVAGFDIDPTGALLLKAADGQALVRARRG